MVSVRFSYAITLASTAILTIWFAEAHAQSVQRFDTYDEALRSLLGIGVAQDSGPGLLDTITCQLAPPNTPAHGNNNANINGLSPALNRHCDQDSQMIMGGASLGGGLFSFQSVRTISQFTNRRSSTSQLPVNASQQNFAGDELATFLFGTPQAASTPQATLSEISAPSIASLAVNGKLDLSQDWPSGMLSITNGQSSLFAAFSYEWLDRESTLHQVGYESEMRSAIVGVAFRIAPEVILGINGYWGHTEGDFDGSFDDSKLFELGFNTGVFKTVEDVCEVPDGGNLDATEWGGSVFAYTRLAGGGFLNAEAGAGSLDSKSKRSLCLTEHGEDEEVLFDVHRGIITSDPTGYRLEAKLRGGYNFTAGPIITGPRGGLDLSWTKVDAYSESETSFGVDMDDPDTTMLDIWATTGAALAYREQDFGSAQGRLGWAIWAPIPVNGMTVMPFGEATFIHEFANDQRNIVAHFVGDTRGADTTFFSFKTDKPDRDFFELEGGVAMTFADSTTAVIGGRMMLGNDLYDSYTVEGSVRAPF
jgi:uncharacterized protein YhjY with autotransporter beta-barrel domain